MPVLHYPPVIGGFEVFSQSTAEVIGKTEDVFVVTSRVAGTPKKEKINKLKVVRTSPWVLKDLSYSKPWFILGSMVWIFFKSLKLIKKEKIELIHAQGFLSGIISYLLKKITKTPYLLTIQSADFSVYHPRLNIKIINWFYQRIEKLIFKNAAYGHAVSYHLEKHLKRYNNIKKTIVIPNGVSSSKFKPDPDKLESRKRAGFDTKNLIVCVSRLEHKNGTHDLIEATGILKDKLQITNYKLLIIGDGSDREKLEKLTEKLNLKKQVFFMGDILHAELPKYVAMSDIFIRPSLAEGFGIVFIEAMAAEVAVVGTPVGGIVDFLANNETGLFCEPGNPKDIAKQLKKLIEDKDLRNKLILNAKEMVTKTYNWDKIGQKLIEIYKKIVMMPIC